MSCKAKRVWFRSPIPYPGRRDELAYMDDGYIDWERRIVIFPERAVPLENVKGMSLDLENDQTFRNQAKSSSGARQKETGSKKPQPKRSTSKSKSVRRGPKS